MRVQKLIGGSRWPTASVLLVLLLASAGCDILGLGDEERLGVLEHYGETSAISVPDAVEAGLHFTVSFYTFGGGCVRKGRTVVRLVGSTATVTPRDVHSGADLCTSALHYLDHTTAVTLDTPGSGTVIVRGRVEPGGEVVERVFAISVH